MLTFLSIKNYALIDDLHVEFSGNFSTITGETGAGKSILLEGLSLVLGGRADRTALRDDSETCVIEAEFQIANYSRLQRFFKEEDLDYDPATVLRREIRPNGKSRAFVNDSPVTLEVLSRLGKLLIDIHAQYQTLELVEQDFQLHVVDAIAQHNEILESYKTLRRSYLSHCKTLETLQSKRATAFKEQDYNSFLLDELVAANLKPGMQEILETQHAELSHAEQIRELLVQSDQLCQDEQYGLLVLQAQLRAITSKLAGFGPKYDELNNRVQSIYFELEDIAQEIQGWANEDEADPGLLQDVASQLQVLYDLQRKHGVHSVSGLLEMQQQLEAQVQDTADLDATIADLEVKIDSETSRLTELSTVLSKRRAEVLPNFVQRLEQELSKLGMPNASFSWELQKKQIFGSNGTDILELYFTANKGGNYGPLKRTASGGELSRIMLVVKAILAGYEALPTIMFDEIDTGVSGDISNRMGDIMREMSAHMQVFAITHLPTVASKGHQQYKVFKEDIGNQTYTRIRRLTQRERVEELAFMLGGGVQSETAMQHARELLG
ncbi:MAG: hypothetical protein RLZZ241_2428 [Bacteroidota bacterium]